MEKVIRNGKVAVLYSGDYGVSWFNSHNVEELVFHPKIVELVEQNKRHEISEKFVAELLNIDEDDCPYLGGVDNLAIEWVDKGTVFRIHEYNGAEWIVRQDEDDFLTA